MIIVAIIGILAAVVIPSWVSTSRNKKYDPEISAMFTEISTKEEQYKSEVGNGAYLLAGTCPASPTPNGADWNASCNSVTAWNSLRVNATDSQIRCTYAVTVGCAGSSCSVPSTPSYSASFTAAPTTLAGAWYYILATCDMDGNGAPYATFFMSSWNNLQQKANYGS